MSRFCQVSDDSESTSTSQHHVLSPGSTTRPDQPFTADGSISSVSGRHEDLTADLPSASQHRDLLLLSLLEEHYRTRAAEFLNSTNPGSNYTRHSPEVQPLAQRLFTQASATLASTGILNVPVSSEALRGNRTQFLVGLDQLGAGAAAANLPAAMRQLSLQPDPAADQRLVSYHQPRPRSHYHTSFRELCLLGRGGFGRVFKCHNLLDQKTYAVKKIPLSPQLSKSFSEGRHDELHHILLEVKTLAALDHANIVRYHTTWVEEPQASSQTVGASAARTGFLADRQQLLLSAQSQTGNEDSNSQREPSVSADEAQPVSCGFVFAEDSEPLPALASRLKLLTDKAETAETALMASEPSANASDIFTDGMGSRLPLVEAQSRPGPKPVDTHVLYIQMSLYPMTLFHYLSASTYPDDAAHPRHCYHLAPSLHIFSAILSGLRYLWARKLIHRDVKPRNIFLSAPEHEPLAGYCDVSCPQCCRGGLGNPCWLNPRIGDFGLVTQLAHGKLPAGRSAAKVVGTPFYRPPVCSFPDADEAVAVADNEKVDIFALGVVFVELLCPFTTVMERADALAGLQKGVLPAGLRRRLEQEGYAANMVDRVLELAAGMVDPDPISRWSGEQIVGVAKGIKAKMTTTAKSIRTDTHS